MSFHGRQHLRLLRNLLGDLYADGWIVDVQFAVGIAAANRLFKVGLPIAPKAEDPTWFLAEDIVPRAHPARQDGKGQALGRQGTYMTSCSRHGSTTCEARSSTLQRGLGTEKSHPL